MVGLVLIGRLFFIQVVYGGYYKDQANRQYKTSSANDMDRGEVFFKDKDNKLFSAASIKKGYLVAINPKKINNSADAYQQLSQVITLNKEDFLKAASKKDDPYEEVARNLEQEQADNITKLKLEGVGVYPESWRFYPGDNLASQAVGFMGFSGNDFIGRAGIEKYYESVLGGEPNSPKLDSFAEIFTDLKKTLSSGGAYKGNVVLTIDPIVQSTLERELAKLLETYSPKMAGAIIIDPKTGKILAMSSKPDFNPNTYGQTENASYFNNPAVESVFEMGSIMKPLTLAGAMDMGFITADTMYDDKGFMTLNGKTFNNHDNKVMGRVNMQEVLNQSLNTGAAFVALKMGKDNFRNYMVSYGFGEKTDIDLPAEVRGKISNILTSPRDIEYATAAFGQGVAVTPIEMATALSSLANGGVLMKPYLVDQIQYEEGLGLNKVTEPQEKRKVLKKETTEEISRMLVKVVDTSLQNGTLKLDHYSVAAKTGTAQQKSATEKGYEQNLYLHTFFGYAPAFDPKFLILFYMKDPIGVKYAATSLSGPFMNMTKFLLNYYQIPPDR